MSQLSEFIGSERERFANEDNNKFAMSFSQISRYSAFLDVVRKRYDASQKLFENTKAFQETLLSGERAFSSDQMALYEEGLRLTLGEDEESEAAGRSPRSQSIARSRQTRDTALSQSG